MVKRYIVCALRNLADRIEGPRTMSTIHIRPGLDAVEFRQMAARERSRAWLGR